MAGMELIFSTVCNATFCESVYDNPVTDTHLTARQNELLYLKNEVNGKHLVIGTFNNYPWSWVEKNENGTLIGNGVAFALVEILQEKFNFTYDVVVPEKNMELGGRKYGESLADLVINGKVDMGAAFLPILVKFKKSLQYSFPLGEGLWSMMLKRPKESAAGSGLLAPFDTYVWCFILAAVLLYGPCITLLTRLRSYLIRDYEKPIPLTPSAWFVYGAFIKQGTTLAPDANTTRVLFATWWLFVILLSAFYTANLTAFLTLSKFTLDIEYPEDLLKKNYRWVAPEGGAVEFAVRNPNDDIYYLNKMVVNGRGQFRSVSSDEDFLPYVTSGMVLIKEQISVDGLMYRNYLKKAKEGIEESERCTFVVAPNFFMKRSRAFVYPKNSTMYKLFDTVLVSLVQSGIIEFLEDKDLPSTKICPLDLQSKDRQLRNTDLLMTYYVMFAGLAAAVAIFFGEVVFKRYFQVKVTNKKSLMEKRTRKANKMKKSDSSRPPPYESLFGKRSKVRFTDDSEKRIINGRQYWVTKNEYGDTKLIPVGTPSAYLYR
ncbi:ionotropic receptor 93a isoform X1 [Aricia agestis]|uniref:ionotropic receptor 93a isoform X1 n=1 Tax=Aricia agestis TaxID=91739 RepID=UPI001C20A180|nr:ionotropic receptor 93a isoform X1 [Aricia agestis]